MAGAASFFVREGERYRPTDRSHGPWDEEQLSGSMIAALLAHGVERERPPGFHVARLTVDLFRAVPWAPLAVRTEVVRAGRRLHALDAWLEHEGRVVSRASALLLRPSEEPPGRVAEVPLSPPPPPERVPLDSETFPLLEGSWERRTLPAAPAGRPPTRWVRMLLPLLPGEAVSALERTAAAADMTNPSANRSDRGLFFINGDVTLYLHRPPEGEWLCMRVAARGSSEGIATAECALFDRRGPVGRSSVVSLAMPQDSRALREERTRGRGPAAAAAAESRG
ncbi:MAG: thioesterase family protein [Chloroflexi bacterium]|nr:thioesterase family protein [Chloroflexota bacterium]